MPIKDIMHIYRCRYCNMKFTMFEGTNGRLIFFPNNVMWPTNGTVELIYHLKNRHRHIYDLERLFYGNDDKHLVSVNFIVDPVDEVVAAG